MPKLLPLCLLLVLLAGLSLPGGAQSVPAEAKPAAGNVGEYARVLPPEQLRYLRSQLARQHHDYRLAAAYLDTLLAGDNAFYGHPRYRYERGILRIDHLNDRAGGCQDLRWVYDHDTARTAPTHPRWRGCPLPARKAPVGSPSGLPTGRRSSIRWRGRRRCARPDAATRAYPSSRGCWRQPKPAPTHP